MQHWYRAERYRKALWMVNALRLTVRDMEMGSEPKRDVLEEADFLLIMERDIMEGKDPGLPTEEP